MYDPGDVPIPDTDVEDTREKRRIHHHWPSAPHEESLRKALAAYYGTVSFIDFQVGRILKTLRDEGLAGNTYVFFTSDHGMEFGHHGTLGHSFSSLYEEQVRVPLVGSGPDVPAGIASNAGIESIDLAPPFLELSGLDIGERMEGRSQRAALAGEDCVGKTLIRSENCRLEDDLRTSNGRVIYSTERKAMRLEYPWKYIYSTEKAHQELYHLEDDPDEKANVVDAPEHRDRVGLCRDDAVRWLADASEGEVGEVDPIEDFRGYDASPSVSETDLNGVTYVRAEERKDLHG